MINRVLLAERILLQTLGFDLQLVHPYKICLDKIKDTLRCNSLHIQWSQLMLTFFNINEWLQPSLWRNYTAQYFLPFFQYTYLLKPVKDSIK